MMVSLLNTISPMTIFLNFVMIILILCQNHLANTIIVHIDTLEQIQALSPKKLRRAGGSGLDMCSECQLHA